MTSPDRGGRPNSPIGTGGSSSGSTRKRVITVPTWARNLPDDEDDYPDEDYAQSSTRGSPPPTARKRSLSSILRPPPKSPPTITTTTTNEKSGEGSGVGASLGEKMGEVKEPEKALQSSDLRRQGGSTNSTTTREGGGGGSGQAGATDRWWTFTLPSKYLDKVQEYVSNTAGGSGGGTSGEDGTASSSNLVMRKLSRSRSRQGTVVADKEKGGFLGGEKDEEQANGQANGGMTMGARLNPPNIFSINQTQVSFALLLHFHSLIFAFISTLPPPPPPQTPGWSSPWTPFHSDPSQHYHPSSTLQNPFSFPTSPTTKPNSRMARFENFVLENPFAPLFFRFFNLAFSTATLGLASHIRLIEARNNVIGVMGSSTLMVIVVAPLAMVHIFINVYVEYFGRPIGLWEVRTKMFYTHIELIFICLYSAILSLSFNDLFTSPLECTPYTPYARYSVAPTVIGSSKVEGTVADRICGEQMALVSFVFVSVAMYTAVLVVSLFRIFNKVSRKG